MKSAKQTNRNEFSSIHAHIDNLIGSAWGHIPTTTRLSSKTPRQSSKHAGELDHQSRSPRLWNETLAFAADG